MKNKDTYCPLPWMHLGTHPHGGVTLCCVSDMTDGGNRARDFSETNKDPESVKGHQFYNLNQHSIDQHMNSDYYKDVRLKMLNNEMPKACTRCYDEEDKGTDGEHHRKNVQDLLRHLSIQRKYRPKGDGSFSACGGRFSR